MMNTTAEHIEALRREMRAESIDVMIIPSTDPHGSEYPPQYWHARQWISGFTGSAGTAVVTLTEAALWTDSRYFLQAAQQLEGSGMLLMKDGLEDTPSVMQWVAQKLAAYGGTTVAVDGMVMGYEEVSQMKDMLKRLGGITVRTNYDPMRMVWRDRPLLPQGAIRVQKAEYAGESVDSKLQRIREVVREARCQALFTTDLTDIAWTMNLRGEDVVYTPVFVAYMYVDMLSAHLFVNARKMSQEAREQLAEAGVEVHGYGEIAEWLKAREKEVSIMCDAATTNYTLYNIIAGHAVNAPSPIQRMKAVKNEAEIEGYRRSMKRDGVALVKWLRWLKPAVEQGGQTELTVARRLDELRAEDAMFEEPSFETISGYNENGAIVHYEVTPESALRLRPEGLLLVDSGGQYADGTTDITRTIALGPVTEEMRRAYTAVLKANIGLATAVFPDGTTGTQLDALARAHVWREGYNYLHGTGHGVGSHLSVHEGPHQVRMQWKPTPLRAGMTVTDEPGVYAEGEFGIRTENTMIIVAAGETKFARFLRMEPLTLCPIDLSPVDWTMMTKEEREWVNDYHAMVEREIMPLLEDEADRVWLREACMEV